MPSLDFDVLRATWAVTGVALFASFVLSVSTQHRRVGLLMACVAWIAVFAAAGLRSENLNSDTESYIEYSQLAQDTSIGDYLSSVRLEPGWAVMTRAVASIGIDARGTLLLFSMATMLMLLLALRPMGFLMSLGMLHYLSEFYLNNELAIVRHSFATAMSLLIVVMISSSRAAGTTLSRFWPVTLAAPPFFHVDTLGVVGAQLGARGSYVRIALQALILSAAAWIVLKTVGAGMLPERLLEDSGENSREVRGFVHIAFLLAIASLDFRAVQSTIENNRNVAFCYLLGIGLSFAVIGFPLLNRLRQVLLEFGIVFYPLVLLQINSIQRLTSAVVAYLCFIVAIGAFTVAALSQRYSAGFF